MESRSEKISLNIRGTLRELQLPCVMGILNITPDSFYSGSRIQDAKTAVERCRQMIVEGAAIIDIGAASTRPGAPYPGKHEELHRLQTIFPALRQEFPDVIFSIDTFNAEVADALLNLGADIINDISAGEIDKDMFSVVAKHHAPYLMMHMRGTPETMQQFTQYDDIMGEINRYFAEKIVALHQLGVTDIMIDPGFGFSKTLEQNYFLLKHFEQFTYHGLPVLAGLSRKSMIYKALGCTAEEALPGTIALNTIAITKGASILRVHDVKAAVDAIRVSSLTTKR